MNILVKPVENTRRKGHLRPHSQLSMFVPDSTSASIYFVLAPCSGGWKYGKSTAENGGLMKSPFMKSTPAQVIFGATGYQNQEPQPFSLTNPHLATLEELSFALVHPMTGDRTAEPGTTSLGLQRPSPPRTP